MKWVTVGVLIITLMCFGQTATACSDHSGGSQSGGQSSDTGDSSGNDGQETGGSGGTGGQSTGYADISTGDGNGPSNFKLIECSNPIFKNLTPCFERMVREREAFVSQPAD